MQHFITFASTLELVFSALINTKVCLFVCLFLIHASINGNGKNHCFFMCLHSICRFRGLETYDAKHCCSCSIHISFLSCPFLWAVCNIHRSLADIWKESESCFLNYAFLLDTPAGKVLFIWKFNREIICCPNNKMIWVRGHGFMFDAMDTKHPQVFLHLQIQEKSWWKNTITWLLRAIMFPVPLLQGLLPHTGNIPGRETCWLTHKTTQKTAEPDLCFHIYQKSLEGICGKLTKG